ncbi:MAG: 7-carboxy-7-deazaguanine synthase [Gemmatimonadota bacterium]
MYTVREIFFTIQGEGAHTGRPAVFCRFSGCNLWTGREVDRATATCRFCDTEFVGVGPDGGRFATATDLAAAVAANWPAAVASDRSRPYVVCTGGEPLLQLDCAAVDALHHLGFEVAVETNGTVPAAAGIDWTCVSPKAGTILAITAGDELKLVYPQAEVEPGQFERLSFRRFSLQPMDGPLVAQNTRLAIAYCLEHPQWRLSLQTHKLLGLR